MKAIIFCISLLFAWVHPSYSETINPIISHNLGFFQENPSHSPVIVQNENIFSNEFLIEIDNDDLNDIVRNSLHSGKTAFKTLAFRAHSFSDPFFKRTCQVRNFLNFSQPIFISIQVLKI